MTLTTTETRILGNARLDLFSRLSSQIAFSDFCAPAAAIDFNVGGGFLMNSLVLFRLSFPSYEMEVKVHNGRVFIRRNGIFQHSEQYSGQDQCAVAVQWDVESIGC